MSATYDREQFRKVLADEFFEDYASKQAFDTQFKPTFQKSLDRGDGWAVYENHDLGHPDIGRKVFVSFGSPAAQIESDDLPDRLPDGLFREITGGINWRYVLVGTYRGTEAL